MARRFYLESTMSEEQSDKKKAKDGPKGVRVVIMQDGVFSSLGVHNKGDKVALSEQDVSILEERGFATRLDG